MPINLKGVELLKADLRANAKHYRQATFGSITDRDDVCGTVQCMAGFCHLRKVGQETYTAAIRADADMEIPCVSSGVNQLGIEREDGYCPDIFESHSIWPDDLAHAYRNASTPEARVEAACAALDRLNDDGTIKEL